MVLIAAGAAQVAAPALNGEGWRQAAELGLALVLSGLIGLEREIRQKSGPGQRRQRGRRVTRGYCLTAVR